MPPLEEWANFYVIVGSSAAALTGLQFVVMALVNEANIVGGEEEVSAFSTPNVVHFSAVLLISAICAMPHQSNKSLGVCLILAGVAGVIYAGMVWSTAKRTRVYQPVFEDWLFHVILPFVAYAILLASGIAEQLGHHGWLYVIASAALLLMYVGIHNAWDTAVYLSQVGRRQRTTDSRPAEAPPVADDSPSTEPPQHLPQSVAREDAPRSSPG